MDVRISSVLLGGGVLLSSFLFYVLTLAPTVIWGDSAAFTLQAVKMDLCVGADCHPLFIILGRLFSYLPFEPAYSLNLLSAVTASLTVLTVYLVIFEMTGSLASALVGAVSLALSHAFWLHAVITEVYDLNALFVTLVILLLVKWSKDQTNHHLLFLAAFLFGLGLSNHLVMVFTAMGCLTFVLLTDHRGFLRLKPLLNTAFFFLLGSSILIYLSLERLSTGQTLPVMVDAATGGHLKKQMLVQSFDVVGDTFMYFAYLLYQYPLIGFFLGFVGIYSVSKNNRREAILLLLIIVINMLFFLSFGPGAKSTTKYTFYISDYAVFSILIGCGFFAFQKYLAKKGLAPHIIFLVVLSLVILLPLLLYNITPYASKGLGIDLLHARSIPYRDNNTFFLNPNKRGYSGAARYAKEALEIATQNAVIIADHTPFAVLRYFQEIHRRRKDLLLIRTGRPRANIPRKVVSKYDGKRDIYLADMEKGYYNLRDLKDSYDFVPVGVLYKISKKEPGSPS
jgi:hypothetical protein